MRHKSTDRKIEEERVVEWMKSIQVTPSEEARQRSLQQSLNELDKSRQRMRRRGKMKKGIGAGLVAVAAMIAIILIVPQLDHDAFQKTVPNQGQVQSKQKEKPVNPSPAKKEQVVPNDPQAKNSNENPNEKSNPSPALSIAEFAPPENVVESFAGEGNEFAQYSVDTYTMKDHLLATVVHGGADQLVIYRITDQRISMISVNEPFQQDQLSNLEQLAAKGQEEVVLELPIKKGAAFGQWKVIETDTSVKVPFGQLNGVVVVEKQASNGDVTLKYWAKKYGVIKTENIIKTGDGSTTKVTSSLEKVTKKSAG